MDPGREKKKYPTTEGQKKGSVVQVEEGRGGGESASSWGSGGFSEK